MKIAKDLTKGSPTVVDVSLKLREFNFDIFNRKYFENRTINTKHVGENVKNIKIVNYAS